MPKLSILKLLNIKLFRDDPKLFKFMQVHESGEDQAVSLTKEAKRILSLLHTRDKKTKKQENGKFSNHHYHIQDINMCNIKM